MISDALIANVKVEEGCKLCVYGDGDGAYLRDGSRVFGHPTVGYGTNVGLGGGITETEAHLLLVNRLANAQADCQHLPYFNRLDAARADAITDMMFNMGLPTFQQFSTFHNLMLGGQYAAAAADLQGTPWYHETGQRGARLARIIASGKWENAS